MNKQEALIESLEKANKRLKDALLLPATRINKDATIKRFEFVFELSWKTIKEHCRDEGFDCVSPKSCIRWAGKMELIDDVEKWIEFLENRNLASHTYNERLANQVYAISKKLPKEVDKLLKKLKS